ncbi:Chymotrypsin-1, partial [Pseudolycoriella hygida]
MWSSIVRTLSLILLWVNGFGMVRINGGAEITIEEAPYMAYIRFNVDAVNEKSCDGVIKSSPYNPFPVIIDPKDISVLVGTAALDKPDEGQTFKVAKIFLKDYDRRNDIAILKLTRIIVLNWDTLSTVYLPADSTYVPENGTKVHVEGWGVNPQNTYNLLRAHIYTIYGERCDKEGADPKYQICTLGKKNAGPCDGDSGGPLLTDRFGMVRINGGSEITIEEAPYMAYITFQTDKARFKYCEGVISSKPDDPNPVIIHPKDIKVLVGTAASDKKDEGQVFDVATVFLKDYSKHNDIAILKLARIIVLNWDTLSTVYLPADTTYVPENGTKVHVDGWGINPQNSRNLLRAHMYTIYGEICDREGADPIGQICGLGKNNAGPCDGDSGGPLLTDSNNVQIGIISQVPKMCINEAGV